MKANLFIDGENFIYKIEDSLIKQGINKEKISVENIDLKKLINFAFFKEKGVDVRIAVDLVSLSKFNTLTLILTWAKIVRRSFMIVDLGLQTMPRI